MSDAYSVGKEAYFFIDADGVSDELVRDIETRLEVLTDTTWLRYSTPLQFTIADGRIFAGIKLWGDNYDFAIHLRALQQLAREMPGLTITVASDEDAFQPVDARRFRAHVMRMFKARPQWDGLFDTVWLTLHAPTLDAFRVALDYQLGLFDGLPAPEYHGNRVRFATDGTVRSINFILSQCLRAVTDVWPTVFPLVEVVLEGKEKRTYELRDGLGWLVMHSELALAVGPVAPPARADTKIPAPVQHAEATALLDGCTLVFQDYSGRSMRLDADGTLHMVADEPAGVGMRHVRGRLGDALVTTRMTIGQRLTFELALERHGKQTVDLGTFYDIDELTVRDGAIHVISRVHGEQALVTIDGTSLERTMTKLAAPHKAAPYDDATDPARAGVTSPRETTATPVYAPDGIELKRDASVLTIPLTAGALLLEWQ